MIAIGAPLRRETRVLMHATPGVSQLYIVQLPFDAAHLGLAAASQALLSRSTGSCQALDRERVATVATVVSVASVAACEAVSPPRSLLVSACHRCSKGEMGTVGMAGSKASNERLPLDVYEASDERSPLDVSEASKDESRRKAQRVQVLSECLRRSGMGNRLSL